MYDSDDGNCVQILSTFSRDSVLVNFAALHFTSHRISMSSTNSESSSQEELESSFQEEFESSSQEEFESSSQEELESSFQEELESSSQEPSNKGTLLGQLEAAVTAQQAAFCCGGTIQIAAARGCIYEHITVDAEPLASPPVVIRWDLPNGEAIRKMTLPASIQETESTPAISQLLESCSPATFGH